MISLYLIACLLSLVLGIIWYKKSEISLLEWIIGIVITFSFTLIMHYVLIHANLIDYETWSGKITKTIYFPQWVEKVQHSKTITDSKGNYVRTEYYYTYDIHPEKWIAYCTVNDEINIDKNKYNEIVQNFGGKIITKSEYKSGFYSGDKNIYITNNDTGYIYPTTDWRIFENRIKSGPSIYSFPKVPDNIKVYDYPLNKNKFSSGRLIGIARNDINLLEFDRMNTLLGPTKKVNVIIVGFSSSDTMLGQYQEAKYVGGRKNDLVICYGPGWSYCFGWTEKELVKRNLETIFLNNKIDTNILPLIKEEIIKNYELKDWSKFDYISVHPPFWSYIVVIIANIILFIVYIRFTYKNNLNEIIYELYRNKR